MVILSPKTKTKTMRVSLILISFLIGHSVIAQEYYNLMLNTDGNSYYAEASLVKGDTLIVAGHRPNVGEDAVIFSMDFKTIVTGKQGMK